MIRTHNTTSTKKAISLPAVTTSLIVCPFPLSIHHPLPDFALERKGKANLRPDYVTRKSTYPPTYLSILPRVVPIMHQKNPLPPHRPHLTITQNPSFSKASKRGKQTCLPLNPQKTSIPCHAVVSLSLSSSSHKNALSRSLSTTPPPLKQKSISPHPHAPLPRPWRVSDVVWKGGGKAGEAGVGPIQRKQPRAKTRRKRKKK